MGKKYMVKARGQLNELNKGTAIAVEAEAIKHALILAKEVG